MAFDRMSTNDNLNFEQTTNFLIVDLFRQRLMPSSVQEIIDYYERYLLRLPYIIIACNNLLSLVLKMA